MPKAFVLMKIADAKVSEPALAALCQKWKIRRLELFGSALTDTLRPDSDVDLLADFAPDETWSLMDLVHAQNEFSTLFGRPVDLVDRASLNRSENQLRRNAILESTKLIYAA